MMSFLKLHIFVSTNINEWCIFFLKCFLLKLKGKNQPYLLSIFYVVYVKMFFVFKGNTFFVC